MTIKDIDIIEGGLLLIREKKELLGDILFIQGAAYDAEHGKIDGVSEEMANAHNSAFNKGRLGWIDKCEVGSTIALYETDGKITFFNGEVVADVERVVGPTILFSRNGKSFAGKRATEDDIVEFTRVI